MILQEFNDSWQRSWSLFGLGNVRLNISRLIIPPGKGECLGKEQFVNESILEIQEGRIINRNKKLIFFNRSFFYNFCIKRSIFQFCFNNISKFNIFYRSHNSSI